MKGLNAGEWEKAIQSESKKKFPLNISVGLSSRKKKREMWSRPGRANIIDFRYRRLQRVRAVLIQNQEMNLRSSEEELDE